MSRGRTKSGEFKNCVECGGEFYTHKAKSARNVCSVKCDRSLKRKKTYNDSKKIKKCGSCKEWKGFSFFSAKRKGSSELDLPLLQSNCRECGKVKDIEFKKNNKKHLLDYKVRRYWEDPEKYRSLSRNMTDEKREIKNRKQREYAKNNKEKILLYNRIRAHRERAAGTLPHTCDIGWLMCKQDARCIYCNEMLKKFHIDHKTPISVGGKNDLENLQLLCPTCNMKKSNLTHDKYIFRLFRMTVDEFSLMRKREYEIRNL